MGPALMRLAVFAVVVTAMAFFFWRSSRPAPQISWAGLQPSKRRKPAPRGLWTQVFDTDSEEEAYRIQSRFFELGIDSIVYEQGKKSVYGEPLKHFGVSVPRESSADAQRALSEILV